MTILASFAFLIYLQPGPATVPLRDGCSEGDLELAAMGAADTVEVQSAIAGGEGVCYNIALRREGRTLSGYVLGEALPAITAYVQAREAASAIRLLEAVAHQPAASPEIANAAPAGPSATTAYPEFFRKFHRSRYHGKDRESRVDTGPSDSGDLLVLPEAPRPNGILPVCCHSITNIKSADSRPLGSTWIPDRSTWPKRSTIRRLAGRK